MRVRDVVFEADEPVGETSERALAVNEVLREPVSEHLDTQQTRLRYALGAGVAGVVLGVLALVAGAGPALGGLLVVAGLAVGGGGYGYVSTREPDVEVTSVQKGYWTGHCLPVQDGTVVYDAVGALEATDFELERLSNESAVTSATERLDDLDDFPVVMSPETNVEEQFTDVLTDVQSEIESATQHTVEAPVVAADSPAADALSELAPLADTTEHAPVDLSVSRSEAYSDVKELGDLEQMAASEGAETDLEALSDTSRALVEDLSGMQETAVDLLNDHVGTAADAFGLVSYNFYCPDCGTDEIDSKVELSDPQEGTWYCETCRSSHETAEVVPRHKLKDDLVNPVWDQLWVEKDDERRKVYENIEDQKADLREREFEQRREEIRSAADRITDLRSRIRDLKTQAKAAEGKVEEIGDLMVKYDRLHRERKREFEQEVEDSFAEIDEETDRILEQTRNEEQERIEAAQEAAKEKAELMREEERRRQAEMFVAEQEMANERARAQMAQERQLHEEELDVEKRQHREEWMLETRGRTSFSGRIDRAKLKKDRLLGATAHEGGDD